MVLPYGGQTGGTETSKYPQEKKIIMIPQVVASERGKAQTKMLAFWGCRTDGIAMERSRTVLEEPAKEGESPVYVWNL